MIEAGGGASCVLERIEEEMWSLEKPRTMLVALISVDSLEASGGDMSDMSLRDSVRRVDDEESGTIGIFEDLVGVGEDACCTTSGRRVSSLGVLMVWVVGVADGAAAGPGVKLEGSGESGTRS